MNDIKDIVAELSDTYHLEKTAKKAKDHLRKKFFEEITKNFSETDLAEDIAVVDAENEEEAINLASAKYPQYTVQAAREHPDLPGKFEVIIREDPEFKSFSVTVGDETWQRQTSVGSSVIDDSRLQEEDPELYETVTYIPQERQMKPLSELDDVVLARLERYVVPGKVTVKLPAPKIDKESK